MGDPYDKLEMASFLSGSKGKGGGERIFKLTR